MAKQRTASEKLDPRIKDTVRHALHALVRKPADAPGTSVRYGEVRQREFHCDDQIQTLPVDDDEPVTGPCQKRVQRGVDERGRFSDLGDVDQRVERAEGYLRAGGGTDHVDRIRLSQPLSDLRRQRGLADAIDAEQGNTAVGACAERSDDFVQNRFARHRRPRDRHSRTLWPVGRFARR